MTRYDEVITEAANKLGFPKQYVDRVYKSYWKVVREHMSTLPLNEDLTDEEFSELQPNINIPSIGKLYVTLDRYHSIKKRFKNNQEDNDATH